MIETSGHLPECTDDLRQMLNPGEWVDEVTGEAECVLCCMLRDCEQRVNDEKHHDPGTRCDGCHSFGFEEGVQAARDAVAAVMDNVAPTFAKVLAAIDGVKGEQA